MGMLDEEAAKSGDWRSRGAAVAWRYECLGRAEARPYKAAAGAGCLRLCQ